MLNLGGPSKGVTELAYLDYRFKTVRQKLGFGKCLFRASNYSDADEGKVNFTVDLEDTASAMH